jgi:hypothetical protein
VINTDQDPIVTTRTKRIAWDSPMPAIY